MLFNNSFTIVLKLVRFQNGLIFGGEGQSELDNKAIKHTEVLKVLGQFEPFDQVHEEVVINRIVCVVLDVV